MKKNPERQCMGCRVHKPKQELIRVVRSPDGAVALDRTCKLPGRGAYICPSPDCLKRVRKSRALERVLKAPLGEEIYTALEKELAENG